MWLLWNFFVGLFSDPPTSFFCSSFAFPLFVRVYNSFVNSSILSLFVLFAASLSAFFLLYYVSSALYLFQICFLCLAMFLLPAFNLFFFSLASLCSSFSLLSLFSSGEMLPSNSSEDFISSIYGGSKGCSNCSTMYTVYFF